MVEIETTPALVEKVYEKLEKNIAAYRKLVGRALTLSEKNPDRALI
jgi:aconitate hydratase